MVIENPPAGKAETSDAMIVCADDYGISHGVCDAIENLIAEGRLRATTAMTGFPEWRQRAPELRILAERSGADIGLHLTLTDHEPLTPMPRFAKTGEMPGLAAVLRGAKLRALPQGEIAAEIKAQFDAFEDAFGAPPAFVDGHQHVHAFPVIRALLLQEVVERYEFRCGMRTITEPLRAIFKRGVDPIKATILANLGIRHAALTRRAGLPHNDSLRGAYNFGLDVPYGQLFRKFLGDFGARPARPLIFCHPGHVDAALRARSTLVEARAREFGYLSSAAYLDDVAREGRRVARFVEA